MTINKRKYTYKLYLMVTLQQIKISLMIDKKITIIGKSIN